MKDYLSAAEIAALALPGLPATKRGVAFAAERAGWAARERNGKGGGVEYAVAALPPEARVAYLGHHVDDIELPVSLAREAAAEPEAATLGAPAAEARDARLAVLALSDSIATQAGIGRKRADAYFCDCYNAGQVDVAGWIKAAVKRITPRTLARWRAFAKAGHKSRLAVDRAAARRGTGVLDRANGGEVRTYVLALLAKQPQLTAHHIRALAADRFPTVQVGGRVQPLPPVRTFQNALKSWKASYRVELESIRNPDGFKSTMRFAARVAMPAQRLNEVWQIDASPADVLLIDGRHTIYVCLDVYSRRMIATVSKTPRASAVGLLIRKAIVIWGVPERIKTDNGSDFVARTTQRLFAALGIEHETSAPFSPEQKGHVERAIGTLQRGLMRTLEGFIGHSVADRKVIENRKAFSARLGETAEDMFKVALTAADLQQRLDAWCADVYGNAPHAGLKGQTPIAVAAMSRITIRRIEDLRALDMLLAPVAGKNGLRTVTKSGLRIHDTYYSAGFLGLDIGRTVLVRMDEADMGRAYVFDQDGETYLGEAISPELLGIDPAAAARAVRAEQKQMVDDSIADAKRAARKIKASDFAGAIHRQALKDAGTLIEFPKPTSAHDTPSLAAARSVAAAGVTSAHSDAVAALAERLRAEDAAREAGPVNVRPLRSVETAHQRWNRAREIEAKMAAGSFVEPDDAVWLGGYREGSEYRGFRMTYGDAEEQGFASV
ncbi:DDE-type integrase/transposase/recombinase [Rhodopseudomonas pseudopalustris]|uniref:DDE-type integrase/transposase/recombinase n=1 Tax=Rhodopseudomonas pseudopalustris TaxID=1513892 RepID=UPI0011138905|nr:DDE-type integrase/transposase/recombinase [Rhodopseudomonas pseudopalustris]